MPPPLPPPAQSPANSPLQLTIIPGRGRAFIATRTIKPGEILLVDSPLLLYPSSLSSLTSFCSSCFRSLPSSPLRCPSSCPSLFCSPLCLSSHPPPLCHHLLTSSASSLTPTTLFLIAAHSLSLTSPSSFSHLLSIHSSPDQSSPLPPSPFPPEITAALLSIDHFYSFAIMDGDGPDRKVRAYGIYPMAALFNHDCLPNACRFDYVDRVDGNRNNAELQIRAVHEISEGREVCLSYFRVNWGYKERQKRLWEDYGFRCGCERCEIEKNWKVDEEEEEEGNDERMAEEGNEEEEEEDDFPHAFFFAKFVCDKEGCGGTLAPLPPSAEGVVSDVLECNVCGKLKKDVDDDDDHDDGDGDMVDGDD